LNRVLALRVAEVHGLITETIIMRPEYGNRSLRERDLADADPVLAVDGASTGSTSVWRSLFRTEHPGVICFQSGTPMAWWNLVYQRIRKYARAFAKYRRGDLVSIRISRLRLINILMTRCEKRFAVL